MNSLIFSLYPRSPEGEGGILFYLCPSFRRPRYFSSHFSQQLSMAEIWYLVTSFISVPHIVGSVFGPIRFLLPVCRLCWFLYTLNIHVYAHFSSHLNFFSATIDGRNLIFGHKLHIGTPYRGKHFLTRQIPTSCLPKSGGIIREH